MKILGAVPNISEGHNQEFIDDLLERINKYENLWFLTKKIDDHYNRTIISIAGKPSSVKDYLFELTKICSENLDLTKHKGTHPRIGAVDVIPLIPITNVTSEEAIEVANELGKKIAEELQIPVYFYEKSTNRPSRKHINYIRKGEFEKLAARMNDEDWKPDYGPSTPHPKAGATIVGVRDFLISLDFITDTKNKWLAQQIKRELLIDLPGSVFLDRDKKGYYEISINISSNLISLNDLFYKVKTVLDHFECNIWKIGVPSPLTSKILTESFENMVGRIQGKIETIEEIIVRNS